jgi:hypothetical protein
VFTALAQAGLVRPDRPIAVDDADPAGRRAA